MKTSRYAALVLAATLPQAAQAHPGDHSRMTLGALAGHMASQPFHLGWLAVLVLAGGVGAWLLHAGGTR